MNTARVGADCLSELLLDRLVAGEVVDAERGEVDRHLQGCPGCRERERRRIEEAQRFAATAPSLRRSRPGPEAPVVPLAAVTPSRVLAGVAALAALAAAVVLVPRGSDSGGGRPGIKGPGLVQVFVNNQGSVREYRPGDRVSPGDGLAFMLHPAAPPASYLVVLGRDGSGTVELYHPEGGVVAAPLVPAGDGALPFSVRLDARPGPEVFFFYVCTAPVPVDAIRRSLQAGPGDVGPPACQRRSVVLEKQTTP